MRIIPLLLAGFVAVGCSGVGNPPPHIVVPQTTVTPESVNSVAAPSQIIIDKIGVNTALKPTGVNAKKVINVPDLEHGDEADWLCEGYNELPTNPSCRLGAIPGALGPAVVVGHVDAHDKPGVFFRLKQLTKGDEIQIRRVDGRTLTFRVSHLETIEKNSFPTARVYRNVDHPELRLLTCGGPFVGGELSYRDQVIVYADLV